MNVNSISAVNFNGKAPNVKTIKSMLKNGETGVLEFSEKHCYAYSTRGDGNSGLIGRYVGSPRMKVEDYMSCIERLEMFAKDGFSFLKEFKDAILKK